MNIDSIFPYRRSFIPVFAALVLCTACATPAARDERVDEIVIGSMMLDSKGPWRLDSAWQAGGMGGSALRTASIEHVVSQVDLPRPHTDTDSAVTAKGKETSPNQSAPSVPFGDDQSRLERAWRKYCHHQLDLTEAEHDLIERNPPPVTSTFRHCDPRSLKK
ncbi:hypothetical protein QZJ86_19870 [Methylomonas montana]|uniref:hypothetical protein n=1 Tax=Methylomonas montana TaxID=3058963 RepID=UPI00265AE058|nr:hypothetical protein [Methylomonas montana]WKJ90244.1 hypothetical protein QZJ86_19870 [Methylomonas montana]